MPDVVVSNLVVIYPPKKNPVVAVKRLNARFPTGKVSAIIGASGCGKTTLLKSIIGVTNIEEGTIKFDEIEINGLPISKRNISYVDQNIRLYPHLNVFNNIAYPISNIGASGDEIKQRVNSIAKQLDIEFLLLRKPKQLSIGQAQKVALAKAMVKNPYVYLFDEPFSNIDEPTALSLIADFKPKLSLLNSTVIFITHNYKEALAFADRIFVMDDGAIVDEGTPEEILKSENTITQSLLKE